MGPAVVMRLQAALLRDVRGKFLDDPAVSAIEDLRHTLAEATQDTLGQAGRRTAAATSSCARSSPANRFASLKTTLRHERMHRQQIALSGGAFTSHVDWDALLNHPLTLAAFRRQCFQAALHRGAELPGARLDLGGGHLRQVAALRTRCSRHRVARLTAPLPARPAKAPARLTQRELLDGADGTRDTILVGRRPIVPIGRKLVRVRRTQNAAEDLRLVRRSLRFAACGGILDAVVNENPRLRSLRW